MRRVLVAVLVWMLCAAAVAKPLPVGAAAPDDLGKTLSGQAVTVSGLYGKVVVISFWATWCKYCLQEMPILGGLQIVADEKHLPLQVVEINYEEGYRTFARATRLLLPKLPGLLMTWDRTGALAHAFGVGNELPAMIILHRNGTIADIEIGYDKSELDPLVAEINQLMNEPAPPPPAAAHPASPSAGVTR